jgi:cytosine/adenosine deaminase-related metal-dependent hydrolase
MAEVRRLAPAVPASRILRSATLDGAQALGFETELGTLASGKRAELLVVSLPSEVADIEEHLVSGIEQESIGWLSR